MTPLTTQTERAITCVHTTEILSQWRDQQASAEELKLLTRHLQSCLLCQQARPQFEQLFGRLDQLFHTSPNLATPLL